MKYRKKPIDIEAIQWVGEDEDILNFCNCPEFRDGELYIYTLEGQMHVSLNDYIIKGIKGEFYPCKPDIFDMTYDKVI